jgi:dimethylhistidine N-methyltransferase
MVAPIHSISDAEIVRAVDHGLSQENKSLPGWLLYDEEGEKIFQRLVQTPEYYLTRCELDILVNHKEDLLRYFDASDRPLLLVDLGTGDGAITEVLLDYFSTHALNLQYYPVDLSATALDQLAYRMASRLPGLAIHPISKNYQYALSNFESQERKVLLFLGGNIGNFSIEEIPEFLTAIGRFLHDHDHALIGFDLKKYPRAVDLAYNDPGGLTREFNLNILKRINRELEAKFDVNQFDFYACYDPEKAAVKGYLISLMDQTVFIHSLGKSFHFSQWETIQTDIAQKFDLLTMEKFLSDSGLEIVDLFFDSNHYYCDVLVKKG